MLSRLPPRNWLLNSRGRSSRTTSSSYAQLRSQCLPSP
jgi:hypothetical protein